MDKEDGSASETTVTTIEVEKELFLKFKALCVLKELKMSAQIEKMIRQWVDENATDLSGQPAE